MLSNLLIALVLYSLGWEATFHGCKALLEDKSGFLGDTAYKDCLAVAKYWPVSLIALVFITAFYLVSPRFKSWILNRQLRKMTHYVRPH